MVRSILVPMISMYMFIVCTMLRWVLTRYGLANRATIGAQRRICHRGEFNHFWSVVECRFLTVDLAFCFNRSISTNGTTRIKVFLFLLIVIDGIMWRTNGTGSIHQCRLLPLVSPILRGHSSLNVTWHNDSVQIMWLLLPLFQWDSVCVHWPFPIVELMHHVSIEYSIDWV